jgi:hypothetical protein
MTALGNAQGSPDHTSRSPERAASIQSHQTFSPSILFRPTGLAIMVILLPQGVALGCHIFSLSGWSTSNAKSRDVESYNEFLRG